MNILLVNPEGDSGDIVNFWLECQSGEVHRASNITGALESLKNNPDIELLILDINDKPAAQGFEQSRVLFAYLNSLENKIPMVVVSSEEEEALKAFPELKILGIIPRIEFPERVAALIRENFPQVISEQKEYCRIRLRLLIRIVPLAGDLYIRLSSRKYVKLFRVGRAFSADDLEKYLEKKKVEFFCIKTAETAEFVQKLKEDVQHMLQEQTENPGDRISMLSNVADVQEQLVQLSKNVGFTSEIKEVAQENVKLALAAIGHSPKLSRVLAPTLKDKNYITSHSVALAEIACSLSSLVGWSSPMTFHKLVLASLFHDFTFSDPELAAISSRYEVENKRKTLTKEQIDEVLQHGNDSADVIRSLTEVPADVELIVTQHHERPDGSGFPSGLRSADIAPLAAVFIIAHDLYNFMMNGSGELDVLAFLKTHDKDYQLGNFKVIARAVGRHSRERTLFASDPSTTPTAAKKAS